MWRRVVVVEDEVLAAGTDEAVAVFDAGLDDYVTKLFGTDKLPALRRVCRPGSEVRSGAPVPRKGGNLCVRE